MSFVEIFNTTETIGIVYPQTAPVKNGNYVDLMCGTIAAAFIIIIMIVFIIDSFNIEFSKKKRTNKKPLRLAMGVFIGDMTIGIIAIVQTILFFNGSNHAHITLIIGAVVSSLIVSLMYAFMMLRLYDTFKNTIYEVTRISFTCHTIVAIYVAIGSLFFPAVLLKDFGQIEKSVFIVIILVPFTLGLAHLIYLFNSKLFSLVLLQRETLNSSDEQRDLDERQLKLLTTIRKHTILGIFIILSECLLLFYGVFVYGLQDVNATTNAIGYWFVTDLCIIIESTCLFLGFSDHNKQYMFMCKHCDKQCTNVCITLAMNRMNAKDKDIAFSVTMTENKNQKNVVRKNTE